MCHDESSYKDPHMFEPQRFLDQVEMASPPTTSIAYGFGRRYAYIYWNRSELPLILIARQSESVPAAGLPMHRFGSLPPSLPLQ